MELLLSSELSSDESMLLEIGQRSALTLESQCSSYHESDGETEKIPFRVGTCYTTGDWLFVVRAISGPTLHVEWLRRTGIVDEIQVDTTDISKYQIY